MKIAIYGGSFNPVHTGHIEIAKYAIEKLSLDKLFFMPAYKSPFKKNVQYTDSKHRIHMLNLVKPEKSEVSLFEINRKGISYTIDTVNYFKQKYPDAELFILIGTDQLYKLHKWRNISDISKIANIVAFKREGKFSKENIKKFNCKLLNNPIYNGSSTNFRNGDFNYIDPKVNKYIGENYLFIQDLMLGMLDHKRHKHSTSVASYAAKIAKQNGVDAKKAWVAGCLHDITKTWPKEKHREFLSLFLPNEKFEDFQLHSLSGYFWIKSIYMLDDEDILNAVLKHTNLANELSIMDKVLYVADKICEGRKHPGIQKERKMVWENFEQGFKMVVKGALNVLTETRNISKDAEAIMKKWSE